MNHIEFARLICIETFLYLEKCKIANYQPDERGITTLIDFWYRSHSPSNIGMHLTPPDKEAERGTDIELWIRYKRCWKRFAMQSKILHLREERYKKFAHELSDGTLQIDKLIDWAKKKNAVPLYLLYNTFENPSEFWRCKSKDDARLLGISIAQAKYIRSIIGRRGYRTPAKVFKHRSSLPFSCLLSHIDIACSERQPNISKNDPLGSYQDADVPSHIVSLIAKEKGEGILYEGQGKVFHADLTIAIDNSHSHIPQYKDDVDEV